MNLFTIVFTVLMALPRFHSDTETPTERAARMAVTAHSIVSATHQATCTEDWAAADWCTPIWPKGEERHLALLLVTQGFWESRFAAHVHADHCKPDECDPVKLPGGVVWHRAKSVWQLQRTSFTPDWPDLGGTSEMATTAAAWDAAKILAAARSRCSRFGDWDAGAISGYAGYTCQWSRAGARVLFFRRLMAGVEMLSAQLPDSNPERVEIFASLQPGG